MIVEITYIVPTLPDDVNVLIDYMSIIMLMDILKKSGKGGIYNLVHRRQIIVACKLVGRQAPKSLLTSGLSVRAEDITKGNEEVEFTAIPVQADEGTTDESYFELEELQDLFDSEQNIDEIEQESS